MKTLIFLILVSFGFFSVAYAANNLFNSASPGSENALLGKWVKMGPAGPVGFEFKADGTVEGDFSNNQTVDVVAKYAVKGDTIQFIDTDGQMCAGIGRYKLYQTDYYLSLDLIDDDCSGRIQVTMGFWTKPGFSDFLKELDHAIAVSPKPDHYLHKARIYLATGMPQLAKENFDQYLLTDTLDASVYVNRAGTRFPGDLSGVIVDCNKSIALDPLNKNAYFLRGLAHYELGNKEQGCQDFEKAIELGFPVLRIAEQERCADFWKHQ